MSKTEHITTLIISAEWGSLDNFALTHGVSPASTKMLIYVDNARSRPVEEAMMKYGYLNLLKLERELKEKGQTFWEYAKSQQISPPHLLEQVRKAPK